MVTEAYCIHMLLVTAPEVENRLLCFNIVDDDGVFGCTCDNFASIS